MTTEERNTAQRLTGEKRKRLHRQYEQARPTFGRGSKEAIEAWSRYEQARDLRKTARMTHVRAALWDLDGMTEADEGAHDVVSALCNLRYQIERQETLGVIAMYEQAARKWGQQQT